MDNYKKYYNEIQKSNQLNDTQKSIVSEEVITSYLDEKIYRILEYINNIDNVKVVYFINDLKKLCFDTEFPLHEREYNVFLNKFNLDNVVLKYNNNEGSFFVKSFLTDCFSGNSNDFVIKINPLGKEVDKHCKFNISNTIRKMVFNLAVQHAEKINPHLYSHAINCIKSEKNPHLRKSTQF
jgi:hypothetical protein